MFASNHSDLQRGELDLILTARRTIVKYNDRLWSRKDRPHEWDITIGAKDSAEVTDLVGIYLLHKLAEEFPEVGGGLYRDDILLTVVKCVMHIYLFYIWRIYRWGSLYDDVQHGANIGTRNSASVST